MITIKPIVYLKEKNDVWEKLTNKKDKNQNIDQESWNQTKTLINTKENIVCMIYILQPHGHSDLDIPAAAPWHSAKRSLIILLTKILQGCKNLLIWCCACNKKHK